MLFARRPVLLEHVDWHAGLAVESERGPILVERPGVEVAASAQLVGQPAPETDTGAQGAKLGIVGSGRRGGLGLDVRDGLA